MMNKNTRLYILFISICIILSVFTATISFAANEDANVTLNVEKSNVYVGDTFKVVLANSEATFQGLSLKLRFDTNLVECIEMLNVDGDDGDDDLFMYYLNSKGKPKQMSPMVSDTIEDMDDGQFSFAMMPGEDTTFLEGDIVVFTFKAIKDGELEFVLEEHTVGVSEYKGETFFVVTITEETKCEHTNTTTAYAATENSKHTVTVTCDDCGETVGNVTEEACDTNGAKCVQWTCDKCDASYAANTDHNYDKLEHKCVCGDVEKYTLTIKDWHTESITFATFEVPYGAKLVDYLDSIEIADIYVNHESANGVYEFSGDWMFFINEEGDTDLITSESTMIADDYTVFAYFSFTGWTRYYEESGYYWGYLLEDYSLEGWNEIDGDWYYFNTESGARAEGLTRVPYPTNKINGNTYAPNQEDIDYSVSKGRVFIDKDEAWFLFDENGKFQSEKTGIINGIYALNGMIAWHPGVVEFEGDYYYFIGDLENGGNKLAEGDTWVTRNNTDADFVIGGCYNFVNGKLSGINGVINGKYYENSRLMLGKGLVKLDDGYIYVRSNGDVVVDRDYWVAKTNGYSIVNGIYTFDENGYIVDPIDPTVYDGIVEVDGVKYYYEDGIKQYCKGVVEMTDENGDIYYIYVKSDGSLATGTYWPTNTNNYLERGAYDWGTDGRYYPAD